MSAAPVTIARTHFAKRYTGDLRRALVLDAIAHDAARNLFVVELLLGLAPVSSRVLVVCGSSSHATAIEAACLATGGLVVRAILASGTEAEHRELVGAWEARELDALLVPIAWLEEHWWKKAPCGAIVVSWPIPERLPRIIERTKAREVLELHDGFPELVGAEDAV